MHRLSYNLFFNIIFAYQLHNKTTIAAIKDLYQAVQLKIKVQYLCLIKYYFSRLMLLCIINIKVKIKNLNSDLNAGYKTFRSPILLERTQVNPIVCHISV